MRKLAPVYKIPRTRVVEREPELLRLCTGKKVLHLGCADVPYTTERGDRLLHKQLALVTDRLWGIDSSDEGCALLREMGFENILSGRLGDHSQAMYDEAFDIILAGEVIEHTDDPGGFLREVNSAMRRETELLLTTVNTPTFVGMAFALLGREKVHPDHNYYFSYRTLTTLVRKQDFDPLEIYYYANLNSPIDKLALPLKKVWPTAADGLILRAKKK